MFTLSAKKGVVSGVVAVATLMLGSLMSLALPAHNVPRAVEFATDLGRLSPDAELNLTVVLKLHNQAEYDQLVESLYDPSSSHYHKWLTESDFARYAPTKEELEAVSKELQSHGLTVVSSDPDRFWVRVHGNIGQAENAFQTELHGFRYNGTEFTAHTRDAALTGAAGSLVQAVAGLERHQARPQLVVAKNLQTGKPILKKTLKSVQSSGGFASLLTGTPLSAAQVFTFTTPGASEPVGVYYGTVYDANPNLVVSYTPAQLQAHYGLTSLYEKGYKGHGQTIALVEAYGYAAAEADANAAAQIFDLPALTSSNFAVVYPEGQPLNPSAADLTGWSGEIALDIQSAHAIAPEARIVVVASAGQDNEDQIASLNYIINHKLAYTVSSSWENDSEIIAGSAEEEAFNSVLKKGAAAGISFQFSTGDNGDLGLGSPVGAVSVPSNSPYATAVGGTSILNNPYGSGQIVAGWGNNATLLASGGPLDPPEEAGFQGGAGGGESSFYAKPSWQKSLAGTGRQVPDVSALADPYTGFPIVITSSGIQYAEAGVGGTSLASPIFTAIWAIANQYNGSSLGEAAVAVAHLKSGHITDVKPASGLNAADVAGTVYDASGASFYSATALFNGSLYSQTQFPSAIWQVATGEYAALSFGTDSSLTVTDGWDNVTGWGEPNGLPFIQGVSGKTTGSLGK
jgi:subtilase family serine protease